ncbi:MAG: hypothetical protein WD037_13950, partial [Balneolales bacterium]
TGGTCRPAGLADRRDLQTGGTYSMYNLLTRAGTGVSPVPIFVPRPLAVPLVADIKCSDCKQIVALRIVFNI